MSILSNIPEIVCPQCRGKLKEERAGLNCGKCEKMYPIKDGIPHLLDDSVKDLVEEISVQDKVAIEYEKKRYNYEFSNRYHQWWAKEMLTGIDVGGRVLDNGCGVGLFDGFISRDRLVGIDISTVMLSCAAERCKNLVLGNSQALPFEDNSFDLVICRSLLHHLREPKIAVAEISRTLRKGGYVSLADTNTSLLSHIPRLIAKHGSHFSEDHKNMSASIIKELLEPYLEITEIKYFGYVAYPLIGFPDIVSVYRYFPYKNLFYKLLMGIDEMISHLLMLKKQSWGIIVKARKQ